MFSLILSIMWNASSAWALHLQNTVT
jgi:hypothetical protein